MPSGFQSGYSARHVQVVVQANVNRVQVIGEEAVVSAGSAVTPKTVVDPGWLVGGVPAKPIKELSDRAKEGFRAGKDMYVELGQRYLSKGL